MQGENIHRRKMVRPYFSDKDFGNWASRRRFPGQDME